MRASPSLERTYLDWNHSFHFIGLRLLDAKEQSADEY